MAYVVNSSCSPGLGRLKRNEQRSEKNRAQFNEYFKENWEQRILWILWNQWRHSEEFQTKEYSQRSGHHNMISMNPLKELRRPLYRQKDSKSQTASKSLKILDKSKTATYCKALDRLIGTHFPCRTGVKAKPKKFQGVCNIPIDCWQRRFFLSSL